MAAVTCSAASSFEIGLVRASAWSTFTSVDQDESSVLAGSLPAARCGTPREPNTSQCTECMHTMRNRITPPSHGRREARTY